MVYHVARVAHWIQAGSVGFCPTHIAFQLHFPAWAEYAVLQAMVPSGDDQSANLVQWVSMLGSLAIVRLIAAQLGAGKRGQYFAVLAAVSLPLGILGASTAKNDHVASLWLSCLVSSLLAWKARGGISWTLAVGTSLGLALLTQGTAYVYAAPPLVLVGLLI
jgi:4-amino-4-deoxy-L-arabinose transferase-like glycosyltransferase